MDKWILSSIRASNRSRATSAGSIEKSLIAVRIDNLIDDGQQWENGRMPNREKVRVCFLCACFQLVRISIAERAAEKLTEARKGRRYRFE